MIGWDGHSYIKFYEIPFEPMIFENPGYIIFATVVSIAGASVSTIFITRTIIQVTF